MKNNDTTIWFYFDELYPNQEAELRKLGFIDGIYTCPCGTCDSRDVLFIEFSSKEEAEENESALEENELLSPLFA